MTGTHRYEHSVTSRYTNPEASASYLLDTFDVLGKTFAFMQYVICDENGEPSFKKINEALRLVAALNGLNDKPNIVFMLKDDGTPVSVHVNYEKLNPMKEETTEVLFPTTNSIGGFGFLPHMDVFWEILFTQMDDLTYSPIIVVPTKAMLFSYGNNPRPSYPEPDMNIPYAELDTFKGKVYDGSLDKKYPELKEFKGMQFGHSPTYAYNRKAEHMGKDVGIFGSLQTLQGVIGTRCDYQYNEWEIIGLRHDSFKKDEDYDTKKPYFMHYVMEELKHIRYSFPPNDEEKRRLLLDKDLVKFATLAATHGLEVEVVEPQYTNKSPVTPWYRCYDEQSGAIIIMGWRWRVDELQFTFAKPVRMTELHDAFGDMNTTKYIDGEWSGESVISSSRGPEKGVTSFTIHTWNDEATNECFAKLLDMARKPILETVS